MAEDTEHLLPGGVHFKFRSVFTHGDRAIVFDCFAFHLSLEYSPSPTVFLALVSYSCEDWGSRSLPIQRPPIPLALIIRGMKPGFPGGLRPMPLLGCVVNGIRLSMEAQLCS